MNKLKTSILACGILASGLLSASAESTMRISPNGGTTWVVISDNGPLDVNPEVGVVRYDGPIGDWSLSISRGQTDPFIGTPGTPDMDLHAINFSSLPATLIVQYSETNLTTFPSETYINVVGYNTTGTVIQNSYRDSGNVLFGSTATYPSDVPGISPSPTALLLSSVGPVTGADTISNGVVVTAVGNVPNSLTLETIINHTGSGRTTVDTHLYAVPQPPCNCTLTFNGPSITNCAGDTIPAVTASQNCGSGPVNVPVTPVSVTTNGTCPQIITRSYTATDNCGTVYPFTQTITVNCKPICTITPSVTTAAVGGSNYTAQVADAGVGATYAWTILNGSITAGQGTTKITWSAGTDTNSPISIVVTVTAPTGCQSTCSASVKLPPQPCRENICGHVFADCDGNGDLTTGDVGISNIIVSLLDSANHLLGKTTTDKNGGYCFTNLVNGNYVVSITPPSGYCQTAASTSYHWRDGYGRACWQENDGFIHCISSGYECWWDKSNTCHWKDSYNRDCWKDNWGNTRCQPLSYKSCNAPTNNNCISVTLTNCTSQTDVDFAYTGTKPSVSVSCSGPSYVKCGQTYTYTCTVVNNGNVCFKGGNVCTTVGNCNNWGGWSNGCNNYTANCPPLSPGQKCTITVKCSFNSWNCGTVSCQSQVNCNHNYGSTSGQSWCYSQCGW